MKKIVLSLGFVEYINSLGSINTILTAIGYPKLNVSEDIKKQKLIDYVKKWNNFTPFAHIVLQFKFKMPIFLLKEYFKFVNGITRIDSFRNYNVDINSLEFYTPTYTSNNKKNNIDNYIYESIQLYYRKAITIYENALLSNIDPNIIDCILPQSTFIEFFETGDLLTYNNIYQKFKSGKVNSEMVEYANSIDDIITKEIGFPWELIKEKNNNA